MTDSTGRFVSSILSWSTNEERLTSARSDQVSTPKALKRCLPEPPLRDRPAARRCAVHPDPPGPR